MTTDELLDLLARLRLAGRLSRDEARAVLLAFEAGRLAPEAVAALTPLAASLAFASITAALAEALEPMRTASGRPLVREVLSLRARATITIVERFDEQAFRHARALARGGRLDQWHVEMRDAVARDLVRQAQLGAGRVQLLPSELARVQALADEQARFLAGFADDIAAHALRAEAGLEGAKPLSEKQIRARARMYAGEGHALFYEVSEGTLSAGWISRYVAQDDDGTCPPCASYDGKVFLPGQGPLPGKVCRGRGLCRCRREAVYDPAAYRRLTNQP